MIILLHTAKSTLYVLICFLEKNISNLELDSVKIRYDSVSKFYLSIVLSKAGAFVIARIKSHGWKSHHDSSALWVFTYKTLIILKNYNSSKILIYTQDNNKIIL